MDQLVREGKVRYIAASNFNAARLCECRWIADSQDLAPVVGSQIPYSLLRREFHNDLEFCERFEIGVTPYQPLQGGLLTGKYQRGQSPPDQSRGNKKPQWLWELNDALFDQLEALEALARTLDGAAGALEQRLEQRAVCLNGRPTPDARVLHTVFGKFYAGRVQPYLARVHRQSQTYFALIDRLAETTDAPGAFAAYREAHLRPDTPHGPQARFAAAIQRHAAAWQRPPPAPKAGYDEGECS